MSRRRILPLIARNVPPFIAHYHNLACNPDRAELFAAEDGPDAATAKVFCRMCPAQDECLEWALATEQRGIWGATNTSQRGRLRKKRARAA